MSFGPYFYISKSYFVATQQDIYLDKIKILIRSDKIKIGIFRCLKGKWKMEWIDVVPKSNI